MRNGGIIGAINTPTTSTASGVWGLPKQQRSVLDGDINFESVSVLIQPTADAGASDVGPTGHTVTEVGNANVTDAESRFDGFGIALDGTGDWLQVPAHANFDFGSGDFTIEMFVMLDATTDYQALAGSDGYYTSGKNGNWVLATNTSAQNLFFYTYDAQAAGVGTTGTFAFAQSTWYHVAAVRISGTITLYVDGVSKGSGTNDKTLEDGADGGLSFGEGFSGNNDFNGHIDGIRVTKGVGRYTGTFVAPTVAFPTVSGSGAAAWPPPYEYVAPTTTKLYLPFDIGPIAGATPGYALVGGIADASQNAHTITVHGNAAVTTDQQKFGTHSLYLDGTGDYLELPIHSDFDTTTGVDLTLEFWYRQSSAPSSSSGPLIGFGINASADAEDTMHFGNDSDVLYTIMYNGTVNSYALSSAGAIVNDSTWRHYSFNYDHSATTMKIYKDGTLVGTDTSFSTVPTRAGGRTNKMFIGGTWSTGGGNFLVTGAGHYDDLKFINGAILRTGNFTAPSAASGE